MEAALLQYLLQKGCRTVTQVCDFLRTVGGDVADDRVEQLRLRINKDLKFADIEVRRMTSPFDGNAYVALVNKQSDDIVTKALAKKCSSQRPDFFQRMMTVILRDGEDAENGGCISEPDALRIGRGTCPGFETPLELSPQECTSVLASLVKDGWITHHPLRAGHYALGVRRQLTFSYIRVPDIGCIESMHTLLKQYL